MHRLYRLGGKRIRLDLSLDAAIISRWKERFRGTLSYRLLRGSQFPRESSAAFFEKYTLWVPSKYDKLSYAHLDPKQVGMWLRSSELYRRHTSQT
jgi:hypothetical protein